MSRRLLLSFWLLFGALPALAATPAVDASGPFFNHLGAVSSGTITGVSTTSTNDLLMVFVLGGATSGGTLPSVSSVSGCTLTWGTARKAFSTSNNGKGSGDIKTDIEVWGAFAASAVSNCTVTVTFGAAVDSASLISFGVTNPFSSLAPYDSNTPGTASNLTAGSTTVTGSSTTNQASDLVFMVAGAPGDHRTGAGFSSTQGPCTGWTQYESFSNAGVVDDTTLQVITQGFASKQSALPVTLFSGGGATCTANWAEPSWIVITDAVTSVSAVTNTGQMMLLGIGD